MIKNGPSPAFFCLFVVFLSKQYKFYNKLMRKNVYLVSGEGIEGNLGQFFEQMTSFFCIFL